MLAFMENAGEKKQNPHNLFIKRKCSVNVKLIGVFVYTDFAHSINVDCVCVHRVDISQPDSYLLCACVRAFVCICCIDF